jgi:23S rRNA (adenine2503-C2)-methyltransferase
MKLNLLKKILKDEPTYRLSQCQKAIFVDLIDDWQKAYNLPQNLREKLNQEYPLTIKGQIIQADDKYAIKALITLEDENKIETVLMKHKDKRNTVCVSSQVGCPLGCMFCATGQMGYKRNLLTGEIIQQVLFFSRVLKKENKKVTNIVFMGMGEPFLNYDNILSAINILNDKNYFNIGARHVSVSTIGIPEGIVKLANEKLQINLAISLHAPNDELRNQIIPLNKKYNIKAVLSAAKDYISQTNRQVMFEYIMIKDLNDQERHAKQLAELLAHLPRKLYLINLILYNASDFPKKQFKPSTKKQIIIFKHVLGRNKINVTERFRLGRGIQAACGQLANKTK